MKRIFAFFAVTILALSATAQPPAGPVNIGDSYGEKINEKGAITLNKLPGALGEKESIQTKVKATVTGVCPKKGCWLSLDMPDSTKVFVKFQDYAFFVPTDMIGKTVILEGEAKGKTVSVAELRHYAEDAGKSKEEIEKITKPEQEIRFTAKGVLVVKD